MNFPKGSSSPYIETPMYIRPDQFCRQEDQEANCQSQPEQPITLTFERMTLATPANYAQTHLSFDRVQIYAAWLTRVHEEGLEEYSYVLDYEVRLSSGGFRKHGESQYRDEFYCSWFEVLRCKVFLSVNKTLDVVTRSFRGVGIVTGLLVNTLVNDR